MQIILIERSVLSRVQPCLNFRLGSDLLFRIKYQIELETMETVIGLASLMMHVFI